MSPNTNDQSGRGRGASAPRDADPYQVLGVSRNATADEIKAAYRRLAREHHPDVSKAPDADAAFSRIQAAYDLLSTPEARARYDQFGHMGGPGGRSGGAGPAGGPRPGAGGFDQGFSGFDAGEFSDLFESFFGQRHGGGFGTARPGPGARPRQAQARQPDTALDATVEFVDAVRGTQVELRVSGAPGSSGDGSRVSIKIPPATHDGDRLRVPGSRAGVPGNIIITVRVRPHAVYRMRVATGPSRYDLELDVPINIAEAILGGAVEVPTPTGSASIRVPPGTKSGTRLRLRGFGMRKPPAKNDPSKSDEAKGSMPARGDLIAVLQIIPPPVDALTDADRAALAAIVAAAPDPRAFMASNRPIDPDPGTS